MGAQDELLRSPRRNCLPVHRAVGDCAHEHRERRMPDDIWGTFSVEDAFRRRAFVADVLLYDRLVIPFPADKATEQRWEQRGHDLRVLQHKIEILRRRKLVKVAPWTEHTTQVFRARLEAGEVLGDEPGLRQFLAEASYEAWVDYGATRTMLAEEVRGSGSPDERAWMERPAGTYIEAIAAYPSYGAFSRDFRLRMPTGNETSARGVHTSSGSQSRELAGVFGWELFVPEDDRLTDEELLASAAELGARDELREMRRDFHDWRRTQVARGIADEEALADGRRRLEAYRQASASVQTRMRLLNAFTLVSIAGSLASGLVFPPAGVGAALFTAARFATERRLKHRPPDSEARAFAMFYDAERHFGWKPPR